MTNHGGDLEAAMQSLDLSAAEKKGIKIGRMKGLMEGEDDWQAVGKSLAPRSISTKGIQQTLGRIWCVDKGLVIKDVVRINPSSLSIIIWERRGH
jgi:hypothetical protein